MVTFATKRICEERRRRLPPIRSTRTWTNPTIGSRTQGYTAKATAASHPLVPAPFLPISTSRRGKGLDAVKEGRLGGHVHAFKVVDDTSQGGRSTIASGSCGIEISSGDGPCWERDLLRVEGLYPHAP